MAVADRSIDPRILESARTEFLASGFEKASLKTICEGAGVTTGALYKRYKGKEELFCAVVEQTVSDLYEVAHARGDKEPAVMSDQEHRPNALGEAVLAPDHQGVKGSDHQQRCGAHDNAFQVQFHRHHLADIISQKSKRENPRAAISSQPPVSVVKNHITVVAQLPLDIKVPLC